MTQQTTPSESTTLRQTFIRFALDAGVLSFGEFVTKAGRTSPYFFNAGLFNQGAMLGKVAQFYAKTLSESGIGFDVLFGPAYKGITLASATAVALAGMGRDVGFAYNRKEAKDHGEGGTLVGARLQGKVVIVDDVISAGTSVRESMQLIRAAGAEPAAVLIALDRMEKSGTADTIGAHSAVQDVQREFGVPVISIASLTDLLAYLDASGDPALDGSRAAVAAYRELYGV
jgi:orotate phosphoribosyltransferase